MAFDCHRRLIDLICHWFIIAWCFFHSLVTTTFICEGNLDRQNRFDKSKLEYDHQCIEEQKLDIQV